MKKQLIALSLTLFLPLAAFADCGAIPNPPMILELPQLDTAQLEIAKGELETYLSMITEYRDCVDLKISNLAPADSPIEYFDSAEYQGQFDSYAQLSDAAETRMSLATERFNYLLENSN